MAQRSDSRAAAKAKRTQIDDAPKKARASAAPKRAAQPVGTSKPASPKTKISSKTKVALTTKSSSKTKGKTSSAAEPAKRTQKPAAVASPTPAKTKSSPPKAKSMSPTAKSPKAQTAPQARPIAKPKRTSSPPAPKVRAAAKAKPSRKDRSRADAAAAPRAKRPTKPAPAYLAAELGQPIDHRCEPIGAGAARAKSDTALQDYTLQLWRQMQSGRVVNRYTRAIERAGLTTDEVWTAGITEVRPTSSTSDEMRRYRQKLLFRANLLEAILSETVADLHRLDGIEPASAETARESG